MAREPDPQTQLDQLQRALAEGALAKAYVFRGEERWFREQGTRLVAAAALARGLELARHDTADPDFQLAALLDDLAARPMFAAARCVIVRGADELVAKAGSAEAPFVRAARAFLASPIEGALVVDAAGLRADHALVKAVLAAGGAAVACRRLFEGPPPWAPGDPRRAELVQWLVARARAGGVRLSADEAALLAAAAGNDLAALEQELARLRHAPRERASGRSGRALAAERGAAPWTVAEDLVRGDLARAAAGIERLFAAGFAEKDGTRERDPRALCAVLIAAARSKARQALHAARVLAAGGDLARAAEAAGVGTWPKARDELAARLAARPAADWPRLAAELNQLERGTREGRTVDANDFVALALRWRRPGASGTALGGGGAMLGAGGAGR